MTIEISWTKIKYQKQVPHLLLQYSLVGIAYWPVQHCRMIVSQMTKNSIWGDSILQKSAWALLLNSYSIFDVERAGDQPVLHYLKYRALWICVLYTQYTWYLLASDNLKIKDGRVKGDDWYRTDQCLTCDKAVLDSNLIIILYLKIMFNIGCTYSRAFKYAVMLPQWAVVLSRAALDMQDKIGKVGNTPFYFGWMGGGIFLNLLVSQICLGSSEV